MTVTTKFNEIQDSTNKKKGPLFQSKISEV